MHTHYLSPRKAVLLLVLFLSIAFSAAGCGTSAVSPTTTKTPPPLSPTGVSTSSEGTSTPPPLSPTSANTSSEGLKEINNTQLYYKTIGKGEPLFFLHGRSGSDRYFLPYLEPLAADNLLFFYDQRGTGSSSEQLDLKAISIDQFVEDLEALRVASGLEKISLIGHSRGAIIALSYALKYQAHLNKLVLIDPVPITGKFLLEQNQTLQQRFQHLAPKEQQTFRMVCSRPDAELDSEARLGCRKLNATLNFYDPAKAETMDAIIEKNTARNADTIESLLATSLKRKQDDIDAGLKTITIPTLILHGDFDPIPVASSTYLQQHISQSQLVLIKQSGHFPFVEQPDQVLTAIRAFLRP